MRRFTIALRTVVLFEVLLTVSAIWGATPEQFTYLQRVNATIVSASEAYPGGRYEAAHLVDGDPGTEYSSAGKGTNTRIDFDLGQPQVVAGVRHIDRSDPATVAGSRLLFSSVPDFRDVSGTVEIEHANERGGITCRAFRPITARYVRWQVDRLGPAGHGTVGGAELCFYIAGRRDRRPTALQVDATTPAAILQVEGHAVQPLQVVIDYPYAEPVEGSVEVAGQPAVPVKLTLGSHRIEISSLAPVERETRVDVAVRLAGHVINRPLVLQPVRQWELWFLPHSHNDIGYTHVQTEVERKQWEYLEEAVTLARRTAAYPHGARFKWNAEVMWAVDSYLQQASPDKRREFLDAVRQGQIGLDGLYGNELTALCHPEELFRLLDCARRIATDNELVIDSAMISDVPGYTWGIVPALAQSGIKYFSIGPNHCHRIGYTLAEWGDKPFWWVSPSGEERILCWMAGHAYSWFHPGLLGAIKNVKPQALLTYLDELAAAGYEYNMVQIRYSIGGDNGPPDPDLPEFVKSWNEKYVWPRLVIATTSELMREFDRRYGEQLPEARGDFTPYWEDGAGSSARETAQVRNAADRLVQAEVLWAMLDPPSFPDAEFYTAWRDVILYNEHTWGAHCSISRPDDPFTLSQWQIKQQFALDAEARSQRLVTAALDRVRHETERVTAVDVFNTCSWSRTDLVVLPEEMPVAGDLVSTPAGDTVPAQRLATGQLAFLASDVPPLGASRFLFSPGTAAKAGGAAASGNTLDNGSLRVTIDPRTGGIQELRYGGSAGDVVVRDSGSGLNGYYYVAGRDPAHAQPAGPVTIRVVDPGPLVASLALEAEAPGCRRLLRHVRLVDGLQRVDLLNVVDKLPVRTPESVHFAFAPHIPGGELRVDVPWAVIRPEQDQLPGACKNYLTVGRWVDVSNRDFGLTWATVDAPLIEIGAITVDVPQPIGVPDCWIRQLEPTQEFYSYVMNNYWETNYKASQEGITHFRYALAPHRSFDAAAAARFGVEVSSPLVVVPTAPDAPQRQSVLSVEPSSVLVSSLAPSRDGRALILRLVNAGDEPVSASVTWHDARPQRVTRSSPFQQAGPPVAAPIPMPAKAIITLRAELEQRERN